MPNIVVQMTDISYLGAEGQSSDTTQDKELAEEAIHDEGQVAIDNNVGQIADIEEPQLHLKTYIAIAAMMLMNIAQLMSLQGPPTVVSTLFFLC
jgi:hypothetical protein